MSVPDNIAPLVRNRPSDEGRAMGRELARMADLAEAHFRTKFPKAKPRCQSCAFRGGTLPNGCASTVMDAVKCVMERKPFLCHQSPKDENGDHTELCSGFMAAMSLTRNMPKTKAPWEYSWPGCNE